MIIDLPADPPSSRGPIVMELPPVERPPIVIDASPVRPGPVAPGLSGGRGMFKRIIVACDGMF